MLTDRELQTLRNMGNEAEEAANEIVRLRAALAATPAPADLYDRLAEAHDASLDDDHRACRVILTECMSKLAATPAPAPQGWKLAPVEATPEMIKAGAAKAPLAIHVALVYRAMLAAAPEAGQGKEASNG